MTERNRELSIEELSAVSGGEFNVGRPFLPTILSKPAGDMSSKAENSPVVKTSSTTTAPASAPFDPVKITFR